MVVKVNFFGGDQSAHVVLILRLLNKTVKKHIIKLDDVTNNDVLGFGSRLLFLSAYSIAPMLTTFYNVSIETQSAISDWKLSKVTPIIIESIARMTRVTIDLQV